MSQPGQYDKSNQSGTKPLDQNRKDKGKNSSTTKTGSSYTGTTGRTGSYTAPQNQPGQRPGQAGGSQMPGKNRDHSTDKNKNPATERTDKSGF